MLTDQFARPLDQARQPAEMLLAVYARLRGFSNRTANSLRMRRERDIRSTDSAGVLGVFFAIVAGNHWSPLFRKMLLVTASLFVCQPVLAQQYLPQPAMTDCQARSAAQCQALGCDGVHTTYWWACQSLTAADGSGNTAAIITTPGDPYYDATTPHAVLVKNIGQPGFHVAVAATGLSAAEQAQIKTPTQLGTLLPFLIPTLAFDQRFTLPQRTAILASPQAPVWTAIQGAALVNLSSPTIQNFVGALVVLAIITPDEAQTVLAQTVVLAPNAAKTSAKP